MYKLDDSSITKWVQDSQYGRRPIGIDMDCPHCEKPVYFHLNNLVRDQKRATTSATARCPRCENTVDLWTVKSDEVYVRPEPPLNRGLIEGADLMPLAVRQAYEETLKTFNAGAYSGAAVLTRRTLEGIVSNLLPEQKGSLAQQIRELADSASVDLSQPLITLSSSVRQGGNIGAHFDLERIPDRKTAEAMLNLIEYLIEYLYTLPKMIEQLDATIERLGAQEQDGSESE